MHYFWNLFDKVLYMFRKIPLSIIRSISTLYTRDRYLSCSFCWLCASVVRMHLVGFYYKNISRCTVLRMSKTHTKLHPVGHELFRADRRTDKLKTVVTIPFTYPPQHTIWACGLDSATRCAGLSPN